MTPLQIKMMLHHYCSPEPYACREPVHASSPAVTEQRHALCEYELLEAAVSESGFRVTPRGNAYVEALCSMPIPVAKWVIPDREEA